MEMYAAKEHATGSDGFCHCGSGKMFTRCHGAQPEALRKSQAH
jgi:hypothetical protein